MRTIAVSIALFALGCTATAVDDVDSRPTTFDRLQERPHFIMWDADVESTAVINILRDGELVPYQAQLAISSGFLTVAANPAGDIVVDELSLWFDNIKVGDGMPPNGVWLTNVHIYEGESAVCDHVDWAVDRDSCEATANTPLLFEASLRATDDMLVPIGPEPLGGMGLDLFFYHDYLPPTDTPALTADIRALAPGTLMSYEGLFELADLNLNGTAREMVLLSH